MFATVLLVAQLNLNVPSQAEAMKQLNDVAKEHQEQTDKYFDKRRQEETNDKLDDINDNIQLNEILNDDD